MSVTKIVYNFLNNQKSIYKFHKGSVTLGKCILEGKE